MTRIKTCLLFSCAMVLLLLTSCHNYYKANSIRPGAIQGMDSLKAQSRYFILRAGEQAFYMKGMMLSHDRKTVTATLDSLPPEHKLHLVNGRGGKMRYQKNNLNDLPVLSEVHLYAPSLTASVGQPFSLPLDQVQKIEVIEKDIKRTTNSYVIGALGYTLGAMTVALVIIAATKSSCPFVSAYDGQNFALQGEIYGGAIYPQMARHDYLPLKMAPLEDGTLQLKISNELQEKQYTDFATLLVVKHAPETKIFTDENGHLYSVASPQSPVSATLGGGKDILPALRKGGDHTIAYMDDTLSADAVNTIHLRFANSTKSAKAKLVLTLKNSYWLDQLYGELAKGFGSYYATYFKKQLKKPAAELVQWTKEQRIPLTVSMRTTNGWRKLTDITTVGPLANRTIVVPVDLGDVTTDHVDLSLSSGFMFWEVDYAGLDFSPNDAYSVEELTPVHATDETGKNVLSAVQKEDGLYLEQPQVGNVATLVYKPTQQAEASKAYTYILHTKGWYQHIRHFTNKPDIGFLKQFTRPNAFALFGKTLYRKIEQESLQSMAVNH